MKGFADTGFIVAFGNRNDGHHAWAMEVAKNIMIRPAELAERYRDQRPDLADLCIIRMSELHPKHAVITTGPKDFRVYRRNKREAIPILCPPGPV